MSVTSASAKTDNKIRIKASVASTPLFGCGEFVLSLIRVGDCDIIRQTSGLTTTALTTPLTLTEHLQRLFGYGNNSGEGRAPVNSSDGSTNGGGLAACVQHYKTILRCIFDDVPVVAQTVKLPDGRPSTSLTSNYLCLQCPIIVSEADLIKHGTRKQHRFYVESRTGALYCQMCDDFVWDPTLEELRIRKMGTGSFACGLLLLTLLSSSSLLLTPADRQQQQPESASTTP